MRIRALLALVLLALPLSACGDDEVAGSEEDGGGFEFRPESDAGQLPNSTANVNPNNVDPNVSPNNSTSMDAGMDDMGGPSGCTGVGECVVNDTRCTGPQRQICEEDNDGDNCGVWSLPVDCGQGQMCSNGNCIGGGGCTDLDNDGHGAGCAAGPDCDDTNPNRFPGNPEVCDGIDNDCNAGPDDEAGLGGTCTTGTGACMATGTPACNGNMLVCNVTNQPGSPEVCDMVDNDCDGQVDEGNVCQACTADSFEPNDTAGAAASLTMNTRSLASMCGQNDDWYSFTAQNNTVYRVTATFPNVLSDIDLEVYENGTLYDWSRGSFTDSEIIQFRSSPNASYTIRVYNADTTDNFYHLQLINIVACQEEDGFAPNQSITDAAFMPANWIATGYTCPSQSDFYWMGEVQSGDSVLLNMYDVDFFDDMDLFLWADPDGDGNFDVVDSSRGFTSDELISYTSTHTGDFYFEVRDVDGGGGMYDIEWY